MIVDQHPALIVDYTSRCYDMIFGADFLDKCGITLDYDNNLVWWTEYIFPLFNALEFSSYSNYTLFLTPIELDSEQDFLGNAFANIFATHILDAKYEQVNIHDVAYNQTHLSLDQQHNLFNILSKHKKLLHGALGVYWSLSS